MDRQQLARRLAEAAFLRGSFRLRSGQISSVYWDKYRFESDPILLRALAKHLAQMTCDVRVDCYAGLELGGIPLAVAMALETGIPCLFVRKQAKEYGTCNLVEGNWVRGQRVLVVEDIITTAGQVILSVEQLRQLGLVAEEVACVLDRQQGGEERLAEIGCRLRPLFRASELEPYVAGAVTPS
jgi:orotate phosphoribosyltransferase